MKKLFIAAGLLALTTASPAFAEATPFPSPSQGAACMVTWNGGACGHGPLSEAGTGGFPNPPCNRHGPCDCNKEKPARS